MKKYPECKNCSEKLRCVVKQLPSLFHSCPHNISEYKKRFFMSVDPKKGSKLWKTLKEVHK